MLKFSSPRLFDRRGVGGGPSFGFNFGDDFVERGNWVNSTSADWAFNGNAVPLPGFTTNIIEQDLDRVPFEYAGPSFISITTRLGSTNNANVALSFTGNNVSGGSSRNFMSITVTAAGSLGTLVSGQVQGGGVGNFAVPGVLDPTQAFNTFSFRGDGSGNAFFRLNGGDEIVQPIVGGRDDQNLIREVDLRTRRGSAGIGTLIDSVHFGATPAV